MKELNFWIKEMGEKNGKQHFSVGLKEESIMSFGTIWNIVPSYIATTKLSRPFMHIEGSKRLECLRAPIEGDVVEWNDLIVNNPDQLTEEEPLMVVCK